MDELTQVRAEEAKERAEARGRLGAREMAWVLAALAETLVLLGGLAWMLSGPGRLATPVRVLLVVTVAVGGAGTVAALAARHIRSLR